MKTTPPPEYPAPATAQHALRPYQQVAVERLRDLIRQGARRLLLASPTGSGKGTIAARLLDLSVARGRKTLVMTHREELVQDLAERVTRLGHVPGMITASAEPDPDRPIQIASVATLARRTPPPADLVLVDECHHATAETYAKILAAYPTAVIVGLTATPCRLNGKPLGDLFEQLVEAAKPAELVRDGYLVPVTGFAFDSPRLRDVHRRGADYDDQQLALVMGGTRIMGNVVEQYQRHAAGLRGCFFAVNVEHSQALAAQFVAAGVPAEHVDGTLATVKRRALFDRYRSGETHVLCNVQIATEGFDLPAIRCVGLCRPTLSLTLALQMIGRGRRPEPCECGRIPHWRLAHCECGRPVTKHVLRLHDHASVVQQHGLPDEPRAWSLTRSARVTARQQARATGALRTCTKCLAIYPADQSQCPACGGRNPVRKRLIRNEAGIAVPLEQVQKRVLAPHEFLRWLKREQEAKQHKPGWIGIRFKARFGRWPSTADWAAPAPPAPATAEASHG